VPERIGIATADAVGLAFAGDVELGSTRHPIETAEATGYTAHVDAWLRSTAPTEWPSAASLGALPVVGPMVDDWAPLTTPDGEAELGMVMDKARFDGSIWIESKVYEQGPVATEAEDYSGFAWRWGEAPYIAELTDGVTRKFYLKNDGSAFFAGGIQASAIDIPGVGLAGVHVNAAGGMSIGGTTAAGIAAGDLNVAGTLTLASGIFRTAASGARIEINGAVGYQTLAWYHTGTVAPAQVDAGSASSLRLHPGTAAGDIAQPIIQMFSAASIATEGGSRIAFTAQKFLFNVGPITLSENTAPDSGEVPVANELYIYAKDRAGVTALYHKDGAGVVHAATDEFFAMAVG
jgi:hypothetical protein